MESSKSGKELAEEHCREGFRLAWVANDFPAALSQFRAALEIWPNNPVAHCQMGEIHFYSPERNLDEALKEFREAIRLAPGWGEGNLWLANALHEMKRYKEAAVSYKEAVRVMPSDPRAYISLGRCFFEMEKYAEAVEALQQGIDLKPAYGEISARMMLADAFRETRQLRRALREWQTVSSMKPVWDYEQGEPERAKKFLSQYR